MTEQVFDALWTFTRDNKDYHGEIPGEPQPLAILSLFQELSDVPLKLKSAFDVEEACHCIRMALRYSF